LRDENEIRLKKAYWQGVYDALKNSDRSKSERIERDKLTAEIWLNALDWILGQVDDSAGTLGKPDSK
jgi:hypothetical protein